MSIIRSKEDFPNGFRGESLSHTRLQPGELVEMLNEEFGETIEFNELKLVIEHNGKPVPCHELELLYVDLSEKGWQIDKRKAMDACIAYARRNSYHPIHQYLERVEKDPLVECADIDRLASDFLGTRQQLYDEILKATVIGAVWRVLEPGCKYDTCTVLQGAQGIRKSTWWKTLASPEFFADTPQEKDQDLRLLIQTCWIYELAELEHVTSKRESGALKAVLSSSVDKFRVPYGSNIGDYPRPSIIVGTCNTRDFLRDPTGSRRYWIVPLPHARGEHLDIAKLENARDSIWKAAVHAYRSGRKPILDAHLEEESLENNQNFEAEDPWLMPLSAWTTKASPNSFTTQEAIIQAGLRRQDQISNGALKGAAQVLRLLGYEQKERRRNGIKGRYWEKIESTITPESTAGTTRGTGGIQGGTGGLGEMSQVAGEITKRASSCQPKERGEGEDAPETWDSRPDVINQAARWRPSPPLTDVPIGSSWDMSSEEGDVVSTTCCGFEL